MTLERSGRRATPEKKLVCETNEEENHKSLSPPSCSSGEIFLFLLELGGKAGGKTNENNEAKHCGRKSRGEGIGGKRQK